MERYYTVYKITNTLNGKIYVGMHQTKDLNDRYYGSGSLIKRAIEKYGIDNFTKEYLAIFNNKGEMIDFEMELINEEFVKRSDTYNMKLGGYGGWDHLNDGGEEHRERCVNNGIKVTNDKTQVDYDNHSKALLKYYKTHESPFKGKSHTEDTKLKIGTANSKHQSGSGNSQYGMMWVYSIELKKSKRISKDDPIPNGWKRGRKIKF